MNAGSGADARTTKPIVLFGDSHSVNPNAEGGLLTIERLSAEDKLIEGFGTCEHERTTTDCVRHVATVPRLNQLTDSPGGTP